MSPVSTTPGGLTSKRYGILRREDMDIQTVRISMPPIKPVERKINECSNRILKPVIPWAEIVLTPLVLPDAPVSDRGIAEIEERIHLRVLEDPVPVKDMDHKIPDPGIIGQPNQSVKIHESHFIV